MTIDGEKILSLGGRDFVIRPTFKALARIESRLDARLMPLMQRLAAQDLGAVDIATIAHSLIEGGGTVNNPIPSLDSVGEMLVAGGLLVNLKVVIDCLASSLNVDSGDQGKATAGA